MRGRITRGRSLAAIRWAAQKAMSRVRYLQICSAIPLLVPIVVGAAAVAVLRLFAPTSDGSSPSGVTFGFLFMLPVFGTVVVAPAYILFALSALAYLWRRPEPAYRTAALASPPIFAAISSGYLAAAGIASGERAWEILLLAIMYSLILGYAYVALAFSGLRILSNRGFLRP